MDWRSQDPRMLSGSFGPEGESEQEAASMAAKTRVTFLIGSDSSAPPSALEARTNRSQNDESGLEIFGIHQVFRRLLEAAHVSLEALTDASALLRRPKNG